MHSENRPQWRLKHLIKNTIQVRVGLRCATCSVQCSDQLLCISATSALPCLRIAVATLLLLVAIGATDAFWVFSNGEAKDVKANVHQEGAKHVVKRYV